MQCITITQNEFSKAVYFYLENLGKKRSSQGSKVKTAFTASWRKETAQFKSREI